MARLTSGQLARAVRAFDWERFLQSAGLNVRIRNDEVAGECFNCHWRRTSFYCNVMTGRWICHYCHEAGGPLSLIGAILDVDYSDAVEKLASNLPYATEWAWWEELENDDEGEFTDVAPLIDLPEHFNPLPSDKAYARPYMRYAKGRGITEAMMQRYQMGFCVSGRCAGRLVIPVIHLGQLVSWVARDVTEKKKRKVDTPPGNTQGSYLFNLDHVWGRKDLVIMEGIFDALVLPEQAVATFGKKISTRQVVALKNAGCREITIVWDDDAEPEVFSTVELLNASFDRVSYLWLPADEDPSSLGRNNMLGLLDDHVTDKLQLRVPVETTVAHAKRQPKIRR